MATSEEDQNQPRSGQGETSGTSRPVNEEALIQEMKAGAAPLARIIPITAETPIRDRPGRFAVATVPFLTVPVVRWSKVTVGDTVGRLVHLLQERGGIWLAEHTTVTLTWTVSPAGDRDRTPDPVEGPRSRTIPWVRLDAAFRGAWTGRFALAAPGSRLSQNLWCVATSPLVGILPDEVADKALPPIDDGRPVSWRPFTEALDNSVHMTTNPSQVVGALVVQSAWPGADRLKKPRQ